MTQDRASEKFGALSMLRTADHIVSRLKDTAPTEQEKESLLWASGMIRAAVRLVSGGADAPGLDDDDFAYLESRARAIQAGAGDIAMLNGENL